MNGFGITQSEDRSVKALIGSLLGHVMFGERPTLRKPSSDEQMLLWIWMMSFRGGRDGVDGGRGQAAGPSSLKGRGCGGEGDGTLGG